MLLTAIAMATVLSTIRAERGNAIHPMAADNRSSPQTVVAHDDTPSQATTSHHPSTSASINADQALEAAVLYERCEQRTSEAPITSEVVAEAYEVDRTGSLAEQRARESAAEEAECRKVGPANYRQIEPLLRTAASMGSRDAQNKLLRRKVDRLMSRNRLTSSEAQPTALTADAQEARMIISDIEALALAGHEQSIVLLQQLLSSSALPLPIDPIKAAAWELVSYQTPGQPFPEPDRLRARLEVLDDLDEESQRAVVAMSKSLFERCCAR